jgi:hypothetical protein
VLASALNSVMVSISSPLSVLLRTKSPRNSTCSCWTWSGRRAQAYLWVLQELWHVQHASPVIGIQGGLHRSLEWAAQSQWVLPVHRAEICLQRWRRVYQGQSCYHSNNRPVDHPQFSHMEYLLRCANFSV